MMAELGGRVAIVTGAARGIGEASAMMLARDGFAVALVDKNIVGARGVAAGIEQAGGRAIAIEADLTDPSTIARFVEQAAAAFGRIDVLVNNASDIADVMQRDSDVMSIDPALWDRSYHINLRAPALACKYAIPHMIRAGAGSIINISSVNGLRGDVTRSAYSAMKAALVMLSQSIATQFGRQQIRCNTISPGLIITSDAGGYEDYLKILDRNILLPRRGKPDDIASAISFLASDASDYITGQMIAVDGGMMSHMPYYADVQQ